jgi:hypothetical protein
MMQNPLQINSERYGLKNVGSNKIVKFVLQSPGFKYWPTTSDTCTGLGLPFLNETHGGKIWAQNNPDAKNKRLVLAFTPFLLSLFQVAHLVNFLCTFLRERKVSTLTLSFF